MVLLTLDAVECLQGKVQRMRAVAPIALCLYVHDCESVANHIQYADLHGKVELMGEC